MAQERYTDWKAPVGSKKLMEAQALVMGIGPQYGLNLVSVKSKTADGKYELRLQDTLRPRYRHTYITDKSNVVQPLSGCLVTPDGILTKFDEEVLIPNVDMNLGTEFIEAVTNLPYREVIIIASHLYVEDESLQVATSFRAIINTTANKLEDAIYPADTSIVEADLIYPTMYSWFNHAALSGLVPASEVIVGLAIVFLGAGGHRMINPYHYQWPQPKLIPKWMWDNAVDRIDELGDSIDDLLSSVAESLAESAKHQVPKCSTQHWYGNLLQDIPAGWLYCGKWYVGQGSDTDITYYVKYGGTPIGTVTKSAFETQILAGFNAKYPAGSGTSALGLTLTRVQVSTGIYDYYVDFTGKTYNGVTIPGANQLFLANTGEDYATGTTGGERTHILTIGEMPSHTHRIKTSDVEGTYDGSVTDGNSNTSEQEWGTSLELTGGGAAHENRPPFMAMPLIIKVI